MYIKDSVWLNEDFLHHMIHYYACVKMHQISGNLYWLFFLLVCLVTKGLVICPTLLPSLHLSLLSLPSLFTSLGYFLLSKPQFLQLTAYICLHSLWTRFKLMVWWLVYLHVILSFFMFIWPAWGELLRTGTVWDGLFTLWWVQLFSWFLEIYITFIIASSGVSRN